MFDSHFTLSHPWWLQHNAINTFIEPLNATKQALLEINFSFYSKNQFFIFGWRKLTSFWQRKPLGSSSWWQNEAETV